MSVWHPVGLLYLDVLIFLKLGEVFSYSFFEEVFYSFTPRFSFRNPPNRNICSCSLVVPTDVSKTRLQIHILYSA